MKPPRATQPDFEEDDDVDSGGETLAESERSEARAKKRPRRAQKRQGAEASAGRFL